MRVGEALEERVNEAQGYPKVEDGGRDSKASSTQRREFVVRQGQPLAIAA